MVNIFHQIILVLLNGRKQDLICFSISFISNSGKVVDDSVKFFNELIWQRESFVGHGHLQEAIHLVLSQETFVKELPVRMTAEDFSYYSQEVPACFYRLGTNSADNSKSNGVHHPEFDIDNKAIVEELPKEKNSPILKLYFSAQLKDLKQTQSCDKT